MTVWWSRREVIEETNVTEEIEYEEINSDDVDRVVAVLGAVLIIALKISRLASVSRCSSAAEAAKCSALSLARS